MSRPPISVVMPFAGDEEAARQALATLGSLHTRAGDELILADNSGSAAPLPAHAVRVVRAAGERSPAHARNVGAQHASGEWILFLDADCRAPAGLLDAYFALPVADDAGALAGEVRSAAGAGTLAERYGAAKGFLSQEAHLAHPYLPRAVAANLLVRREAFEAVGGFFEGVRAAEDTDFAWRLQRAGWRIELRREAWVEHRYRASVSELRRQWRGYAAGRAWLRRRYTGFTPEPALRRALRRRRRRDEVGRPGSVAGAGAARDSSARAAGRVERGGFLALDALLALEELAGFALSNRPRAAGGRGVARRWGQGSSAGSGARVVLVAERFPARGDPLVDFALTLGGARVEAAARPDAPALEPARQLPVDYREDDGAAARALALARLLTRHPRRCWRDVRRARGGAPRLLELAPAVERLEREPAARIHPLGGADTRATAARLAALSGRELGDA